MTKDTAMGKPRAHNDEETNGTTFKWNLKCLKIQYLNWGASRGLICVGGGTMVLFMTHLLYSHTHPNPLMPRDFQ
jgi:hypothetical protein